jgi:hypothetical protein
MNDSVIKKSRDNVQYSQSKIDEEISDGTYAQDFD